MNREEFDARLEEETAMRDLYKAQSNSWRDRALRLADDLARYTWRPIAEMRPEHMPCVLVNVDDDPNYFEIVHCPEAHLEYYLALWTHFTEVPKLSTEDAKRLLAEMLTPTAPAPDAAPWGEA